MSDLMFHLVDGSPVFRGDELYVHPKYIQQAGAKVRAEFKTDFDVVTVRSIPSGAVPSLPINALSREPSPEAVVMCEVAKDLCIQPYDVSKRDIKIWNAAVLASRPDTAWDDAVALTKTAVDYHELQAQHDQLQSKYKAALAEVRKYKLAGLGMAASMGEHVCVPEGWQLVPVKPTEEMIVSSVMKVTHAESMEELNCNSGVWAAHDCLAYYQAMLAAAPKPEGGA